MLDNYKKKLSTSLIITAMLSVSTLSYAEIASSRLKTVELEDGSKIKIREKSTKANLTCFYVF